MDYLFGPVPSRRLGLSLGVDLVRPKTCSYDCIYCQLGPTTFRTITRDEYVPHSRVLEEIHSVLEEGLEPDYITLSGSGEPTLNSGAGDILDGVRSMTSIPTAVLTNSSLFTDKRVRGEIASADLVVPSLDAVSQQIFENVNRPHPSLRSDRIVAGLTEFAKEHEGDMWLEVMMVRGVNDSDEEIELINEAISIIEPDKVQVNTVVRPPSEEFAKALDLGELERISRSLGAEMIPDFQGMGRGYLENREEKMVEMISRRPCTVTDICFSLGLHANEVLKYLGRLRREGRIVTKTSQGRKYYAMAGSQEVA